MSKIKIVTDSSLTIEPELVEKYEKRLSMLEGIKLIVVKIEQNITEDDVTLKERINLFYEKCMDKYQSNYFTTIFEIKLN